MMNYNPVTNCINCGANRVSTSNNCFYCGTLYEIEKPKTRERVELESSEISQTHSSGKNRTLEIIMFTMLGLVCMAGLFHAWRHIRKKKKQEQLIAA